MLFLINVVSIKIGKDMKEKVRNLSREIKRILPFKRTVNFVICGTQKGGTTALYAYLREHPEVCMANKKEVHFFDNENLFRRRRVSYSKYHSYFSPSERHKVLGEATPIYMYWNPSPKRIFEYNPNMKIIVILRNPIERAYSHWNMERQKKNDNLSFKAAIYNEVKRSDEVLPYQHRIFSYIDRGHYLPQLRRIWAYFPKEQVLVIKSESLKEHPNDVLSEVTDFLGIKRFNRVESKEVHSRTYLSPIGEGEKAYIRSFLKHEIKELERELDWDCRDWLE